MSISATTPQITIVGAGIAGLVLGRCLLQRGIKATILEKARSSPRRNDYGITLYAKSYRPLLRMLDLDEGAFRRKVAVDAAIGGSGSLQDEASFRANRNRFEGLLVEGLEVQWEREVDAVDGVRVHPSGGGRVEGSVVVGADGPHSVVRKAIAAEVGMAVLPYAVYNGKRRVPRDGFDYDGKNVTEHRLGRSVFYISVNDVDEKDISISYTYSRPAKEGHDPLYRAERPKEAAKDIPENLFQEIDALHGQLPKGLFQHIFHSDAMRKDRLLNWLMRSIRVDGAKLRTGAKQGIILVGDAVHAEPILGPSYGANEAIEDSVALAEFLVSETRPPLGEFYDGRSDIWRTAVEQSENRIQEMHARPSGSL